MSEWMPIETAPKDGTEILAWREDAGVFLVRWTSCETFMTERELEESGLDEASIEAEDWFFSDFVAGGRLAEYETPTHWQPLPSPPSQPTAET